MPEMCSWENLVMKLENVDIGLNLPIIKRASKPTEIKYAQMEQEMLQISACRVTFYTQFLIWGQSSKLC